MPPERTHPALLALLLLGVGLAGGSCVPEAPSPAGPGDGFSLTLAWNPPEVDAEGGPLDDLAGFRLYYGPGTPVTRTNATMVEVGAAASFTIGDLTTGRWYFAVSAMDESGNESELSGEIAADVGPP